MNFIIPKNYNFKNKLFGIIDYTTAIFNTIWNVLLYFILKNIEITISIKICIFSSLSFPALLLTLIGFNNESPIYTIKYLLNYLKSQKVFLFKKEYSNYDFENVSSLKKNVSSLKKNKTIAKFGLKLYNLFSIKFSH